MRGGALVPVEPVYLCRIHDSIVAHLVRTGIEFPRPVAALGDMILRTAGPEGSVRCRQRSKISSRPGRVSVMAAASEYGDDELAAALEMSLDKRYKVVRKTARDAR